MANGAGNGTGGKKNGLRNGSGIATIEHSENKEKTQKEINAVFMKAMFGEDAQ